MFNCARRAALLLMSMSLATSACGEEAAEPASDEPRCGDGVLQGREQCDDGNTSARDGCSPTCNVEPGWQCFGEPSVCEVRVDPPVCGNGRVEAGERCDDGNTEDGDGCSAECAVEPGWGCSGAPSVCEEIPAVCGDGEIHPLEGCDDGNTEDGDGCSAECAVEPGFDCDGEPSVCTERPAVCGDGEVTADEQCDDANTDDGDGCSMHCEVEDGFRCNGSPSVCEPLPAVCGDGRIGDGEACDDGNLIAGDGCGQACNLEAGWICRGEPSDCVRADQICRDVDCSALNGVCVAGVCDPATGECVARVTDDGGACDDGDFCTDGDKCLSGECVPGDPRDCSSLDSVCGTATCDSEAAECVVTPQAEGEPCDGDDTICRSSSCVDGTCVVTTTEDCTSCGPGVDDVCVSGHCGPVDRRVLFGFETDADLGAFTTSGATPWFATAEHAQSGAMSARSGGITHGQSTSMAYEADVGDGGDVSFWLRVSSESVYDRLRFFIDGDERGSWSGEVGWTRVSFELAAGVRQLEWRYSKDGSASEGSDAAWIDTIEITSGDDCADGACGAEYFDGDGCVLCPRLPDGASCDETPFDCTDEVCEAGLCVASGRDDCATCGEGGNLNCAGGVCGGAPSDWFFPFNDEVTPPEIVTGGDRPWGFTTSAFRSSPRSVRSGAITHNQRTFLRMNVSLPTAGEVRFWHREDTERDFDVHIFYVDGVERGRWSGDTNWSEAVFPLAAGNRQLTWEYSKDGSDFGFFPPASIVWVDDIRVRTLAPCPSDSCSAGVSTGLSCLVCAVADGTECEDAGVCVEGECTP